jgi:hypothetical protein
MLVGDLLSPCIQFIEPTLARGLKVIAETFRRHIALSSCRCGVPACITGRFHEACIYSLKRLLLSLALFGKEC